MPFGRIANKTIPRLLPAVGLEDCKLIEGAVHPGWLRWASIAKSGDRKKVSMLVMLGASSVAASGTKENIEKKWNSRFKLKVFERFKILQAIFEATFEALDPKGKQESAETATWFASLSNEPECKLYTRHRNLGS